MARSKNSTKRFRLSDLRTTPVYDQYWRFAAERQEIFFRRLEGHQYPWTTDPILRRFKFTNAYRASDRVSQYLIRNIIYNSAYSDAPNEIVFRVLLFKLFNKISTWQLLETHLGLPHWQSFNFADYDRVLTEAAAAGRKVYSAAYIIPPVSLDRSGVKHRGHLLLIEHILKSRFTSKLQATRNLEEVFTMLKAFPSFGDFLAFQLAIDINYSPVIDHDEAEFVVAGPGARDGLSKVFPDAQGYHTSDLITFMMDQQETEFERLGLDFRSLWGRPLQLIDCQNLFCEISKYARVSHSDVQGVSGRTRIKQIYRPNSDPVLPWYPPKWEINDRIEYASYMPRQTDLLTVCK